MVNLPGKQLIILDVLQANKLACLQNGKWDLINKRNNCSRVANSQESNKRWLTEWAIAKQRDYISVVALETENNLLALMLLQ